MMGREPDPPAHRVELPERGLRIGVISDTHGRFHPLGIERLAGIEPDLILHGGDIGVGPSGGGAAEVLDPFAALAPLHAVRGNIDSAQHCHEPKHVVLDLVAANSGVVKFCILLTHIALAGRRLRRPVKDLATSLAVDLVVCGHSHIPMVTRDGPIAVFNPGSIGPRRFALPICFGVIGVQPDGVTFQHIDCETGEPLV